MLIELWRKVVATDYKHTCCAVCGNDFDRGSVFPVAFTDDGYELGEMCSYCLDYLSRRKEDADDPTRGNWPARAWPSLEDLEEARRRYPEPMYASKADLQAAAPDFDAEDEVCEASILWKMDREAGIRPE